MVLTNIYGVYGSKLRAGNFPVHVQCHHSDAARGSLGIKAVRFTIQPRELRLGSVITS